MCFIVYCCCLIYGVSLWFGIWFCYVLIEGCLIDYCSGECWFWFGSEVVWVLILMIGLLDCLGWLKSLWGKSYDWIYEFLEFYDNFEYV